MDVAKRSNTAQHRDDGVDAVNIVVNRRATIIDLTRYLQTQNTPSRISILKRLLKFRSVVNQCRYRYLATEIINKMCGSPSESRRCWCA